MIVGLIGEAGHGKDSFYTKLSGKSLALYQRAIPRVGFADPLVTGVGSMLQDVLVVPDKNNQLYDFDTGADILENWFSYIRSLSSVRNAPTVATVIDKFRTILMNHPSVIHLDKFKYRTTWRNMMEILGTEVCREYYGADIWVNIVELKTRNLENCVLTDVRFPNEVRMVDSIVGVVREDEPRYDFPTGHASRELAGNLNMAASLYRAGGSTSLLDILREDIQALGSNLMGIVESYKDADNNVCFRELVWYGKEDSKTLLKPC